MAEYRHAKTSLGEAFIVHTMRAVDEHPALLASRLPIFLESEWDLLKTLNAVTRKSLWQGRIAALDSERALRAADPARTAYGPAQNTPVNAQGAVLSDDRTEAVAS